MKHLTSKQVRELRDTPTRPGENRVAKAIELAGVTQLEISAATELPQPYISDVARNRYQTITVDNAHKFSDYFGVPIEDLFPSRAEAQAS